MLLRSAVFRLVQIWVWTLRSLEEFKLHSSVKSQERALKPEAHHTNRSEVSVRQRRSNRKCACHSNWQKTCWTLYWMKKLRSQFLKISACSKIDGTDTAFVFFPTVRSCSSFLPALLLFYLTFKWQLHFSCHLPHLFSLPPLLPCPEGVNCRVVRALVQTPGWRGPPNLSFNQDRLIRVLWALWRPVCQMADVAVWLQLVQMNRPCSLCCYEWPVKIMPWK